MTAKSKTTLDNVDKILSEMTERARTKAMTYIEGFAAGYEASKEGEDDEDRGQDSDGA